MLGSPIGSEEYCVCYVLDRFKNNYKPIMDKVVHLHHPHAAWRVWQRLSISAGFVHLFRTTPTRLIERAFEVIEKETRDFLSLTIFGHSLTDDEWLIVQLPFALGGWNVIPFRILAPAGYLSSLLANRKAITLQYLDAAPVVDAEINATIELLTKQNPSAKLPDPKETTKMRDYVQACMEPIALEFLQRKDADLVHKQAALRGQMQKGSHEWKHAECTAEMFIDAPIFQNQANASIGADLFPNSRNTREICPACKKDTLDPQGAHAYGCKKTGDVVQRHDAIRDLFVGEARAAGIAAEREMTLKLSGNSTYKPDFAFPLGVPGLTARHTAFDLVVINNLAASHVARAATEALYAAKLGETHKNQAHKADLKAIGVDFIPIAFELTGGHVAGIEPVIAYMMGQKALLTGQTFPELMAHFWQLLSVTLQRHLGSSVQRRRIMALDAPYEREDKENMQD
jgi:hypothetical protein